MEKILKTLFKSTQVLKGSYMHGPLYAPLILAVPLLVIYFLVALPFYPIVLVVVIVEKVAKKQWPDKWDILGFVVYSIAFFVWIDFILR